MDDEKYLGLTPAQLNQTFFAAVVAITVLTLLPIGLWVLSSLAVLAAGWFAVGRWNRREKGQLTR